MSKLSDMKLGDALANLANPNNTDTAVSAVWKKLNGFTWRYKGLCEGAKISTVICNQKGDFHNFLLNDKDWIAISDAERTGNSDHYVLVFAKVTAELTITHVVGHIAVADARARIPHADHRGEEGSGYRLLPADFWRTDFDPEDDSL